MPTARDLLGLPSTPSAPPKPTARAVLASQPEPPPERTVGQRIQDVIESLAVPGLTTIGGLAGAALGGAAGGIGAIPGAAVGAGLGGAAGTQLPELTRPLLTGTPARPPDVIEAAQTGALQAAGEVVGAGAGRAVQRLAAPFASKVIPFARDVVQPALARVGQRMTAGQLTESRLIDIVENITEGALFGGRVAAVKQRASTEGVKRLTDELIDEVGTRLTPSEVAESLINSRAAAKDIANAIKRTLYGEVDKAAGNIAVNTRPILNELRTRIGGKADVTVEKALRSAGIDPERFFQLPVAGEGGVVPETTFALAASARSRLLAVARRPALTLEDEAIRRTASRLAGLIDQQIDQAAGRLAPEALDLFRQANQFTRQMAADLDNRLVRAIFRRIEENPAAVDAILARPNVADTLRRIREAVKIDPDAFPKLQRLLTTRLIEQAADPATGIVQGRVLLRAIQKLGDETADAIFGPARARVKQFAQIVDFVQRKGTETSGGVGEVFFQLRQASAAGQAAGAIAALSLGSAPGAIAIIVAPDVLSRILTNPKAVRLLTEGIRVPQKLTENITLIRRILGPALVESSRQALKADEDVR